MEEMIIETTPEKKPEKDSLLFWLKLQTCLTGAIFALMMVTVVFTAVQVSNVKKVFRGVDTDRVNAIILSLQSAAAELENVDVETINKTVKALEGAAKNLAGADIDAVNDGIEALTAAAGHLQELDIQRINELIDSLETVVKQLEKTTSTFGKLFGRS